VTSGSSAGFGRRFAALIYDCLLLAALLMIITFVPVVFTNKAILPETVGSWAYVYRASLGGALAGYYILNWTRSGQTLGMRAWHLRAVTDRGMPVQIGAALLRVIWGAVAWSPAALGVLWLYVDPDHLALHDRLSKTRVVRLTRS
jgi:uncharacterized RDD family membrane protein YckC